MNENDFRELAAGHALHALSETDERAFHDALAVHPEWENHVRADLEVAGALAAAAPEQAPAKGIRGDLLDRIEDLPQGAPQESPPPERARGLSRRGLWALAASIALIAAIGIGAVVISPQLQPPASVVALEQIEAAPDAQSATTTTADGGVATIHWSDSLGQSVLVVDDLFTPPDGHTFELWFVRDGMPIPAGTFSPDDSGDAVAVLAGQQHEGDVIAVTIEVDGGSPDGQPTTDAVLAIET